MSDIKYNEISPEITGQFRAVCRRVFTGDEISDDFSHDEMPIYGRHAPDILIEAESTEEVAAAVRICNENRIPVVGRGAGTGLVGGCVPFAGGVVITTTRMNRILGYDEKNFAVNVEAGVLLKDLAEDAEKRGYMYPPDPGEKLATLGGNVSTNAGGMRAVKYGTTRDYVLAATVVLPTGEIERVGAAVSKTSSGYSLLNLIIGSEGTLGIITELTLKLIVKPNADITLIIPFRTLDDCISTVPEFAQNHLHPQALEFMEREIVESSEAYVGKSVFPKKINGEEAEAYLLMTFDGDEEEELEDIIEKAAEVALEHEAVDVLIADTPVKKKDAWAARSSFLEAIEADSKLLDECDVVVPVDRIAEYFSFTKKAAEEAGITNKNFGHAGDGNIHIYALSNDLELDEFRKRADKFFTDIYGKAAELGGLISGEHGIGSGKIDYLEASVGKKQMQLMEGIKRVFDPNMILNPGKVCTRL